MVLFELLISILCGLIVGSFATALAYRIPNNLNWVNKRSACTMCGHVLGVIDLIPAISWIISKGKCRHCQKQISSEYLLVELSAALLSILAYFVYGMRPDYFFILSAIPVLLALAVIDLKHFILPNKLVFMLVMLGFLRLGYWLLFQPFAFDISKFISFIASAFIYAVLSWGLGYFLTKILKKDALGFGDVKFFFAAGLWLGLLKFPFFLMLSGFSGIILALLWRVYRKSEIFPFGPALIFSMYALLLYNFHN